MAQRSRKRGRRRLSAGARVATVDRRPAGPAAAATDRPPGPTNAADRRPSPAKATERPRSRAEARNAAVRATLEPLAPGERPWPLKIATLLAVLIGGGDLITVIVDGKFTVGGAHTGATGVILFSLLMLVCAGGMWQLRYWAVLGFQAILAFVILFFALLLTRASNVLAVVASMAVLGGGGYLFYKLVRVLSRLQMPKPPGR